MATALTAEGQDKVSRHLFGNSATTYPGAGQCYLSLHSAQPGDSGASQISSGRVAVAMSYDATNKWFTNASAVSVPSVSGSVQWVALWHSPGTGNVWFQGQLPAPVGISGTHSVIVPANALKVYATPPDGSNKGGIADKGAELVLGHFLGVASWTMPTSFRLRCHSADPTRTGDVSVSYTYPSSVGVYMEDLAAGFWRGYDIILAANATRYWSATDGTNTLAFGDCGSGNKAYCSASTGDSYGGNGMDTSGSADSTFTGGAYNSFRVTFDVASGIVNGDVTSSTITTAGAGTLAVTLSLRSSVLTLAGTGTFLVSLGSTVNARVNFSGSSNIQIGDSVPACSRVFLSTLYPSNVSLQTLGNG